MYLLWVQLLVSVSLVGTIIVYLMLVSISLVGTIRMYLLLVSVSLVGTIIMYLLLVSLVGTFTMHLLLVQLQCNSCWFHYTVSYVGTMAMYHFGDISIYL